MVFFVTNDDRCNVPPNLTCENLFDKFVLYRSSNVNFAQFSVNECKLTVIGQFFDPTNPYLSQQELVERLISKHTDFESIISKFALFTGKYVVFYYSVKQSLVFTDFFNEQSFYYFQQQNRVYISSSDKLLLQFLGIDVVLSDYKKALIHNQSFLNFTESWFVSEEDWDDRLKKLLPNHYLDLKDFKVKRIPFVESPIVTYHQAKDLFIQYIQGFIEAVVNKYNHVYVPLTAGYDSRVIMTASYQFKDKVTFFTFNRSTNKISKDIEVAKQLAHKFDLNYQEIYPEQLSSEFKEYFNQYFIVPRNLSKIRNVQWFRQLGNRNVFLFGTGGELMRGFYRNHKFTSAKSICYEVEYPFIQEQSKALEQWLISAKEYDAKISLSDLFYQEIRLGKWASLGSYEMSLSGVDSFTPFNNRFLNMSVLKMFYSLNYNISQRHQFFKDCMEEMLPNSTEIAFNPPTIKDRLRLFLKQSPLDSLFTQLIRFKNLR